MLVTPYAICRLAPEQTVPEWARGELLVAARTPQALTVICEAGGVPAGADAERPWRVLQVAATLAFDEVGVLAALTAPLAAAGIPIFAVSVYETDYLLVRAQHLEAALGALRAAGHELA